MRFSTKLGASMATAALGAAVVLGGAGVAQAQSSDSLGSSDPAPVVLTVAGDEDGVGGTITNNTDEPLTCDVIVSTAEVVAGLEANFDGELTPEESAALLVAVEAAEAAGQVVFINDVLVPANGAEDWESGAGYNPTANYIAGAIAECGDESAFAYEPSGLFGSLDMGSLGS